MEELSEKEKAERYDEIIKKVSDYYEGKTKLYSDVDKTLNYLLPELKENEDEDEKIRKVLADYFKTYKEQEECGVKTFYGIPTDKILDWIEKQDKKTEPIEGFKTEFEKQISHLIVSIINKEYEYTEDFVKWTSNALLSYAKREIKTNMGISEATKQELEDNLHKALEKETPESWGKFLEKQDEQNHDWKEEDLYKIENALFGTYAVDVATRLLNKIKSLKDKVQQQPKQRWSEEDEKNVEKLDGFLTEVFCYGHVYISQKDKKELQSWLKFLKERYTWTPSEKQLEALDSATENCAYSEYQDCLRELIEQLKKLKGE